MLFSARNIVVLIVFAFIALCSIVKENRQDSQISEENVLNKDELQIAVASIDNNDGGVDDKHKEDRDSTKQTEEDHASDKVTSRPTMLMETLAPTPAPKDATTTAPEVASTTATSGSSVTTAPVVASTKSHVPSEIMTFTPFTNKTNISEFLGKMTIPQSKKNATEELQATPQPKGNLPPLERMNISKSYKVDHSEIIRFNETTNETMTLKEIQIENYKRGVGMMIMVHITHHAGTTFCKDFVKKNGNTPDFVCMGGKNFPAQYDRLHQFIPWPANETEQNIDVLREYFHEVSWEFGHQSEVPRNLYETDWENERLLSVIVMRNPMDRFLAFDGMASNVYGEVDVRTDEKWWAWAQHPIHNNNFALRALSNYSDCCQGKDTSEYLLDLAKALMTRFTIVMDQDCLNENLAALAELLNATYEPSSHNSHKSARERIHNDTLYEYLLEKNKQDVKLYQFSKNMSLLTCEPHEE